MLLDEYVEIRWNPNNIKYYKEKGYEFTKKGELFLVKIEDLSESSSAYVRVKCDYHKDGCNDISYVKWSDYMKIRKKNIVDKDCCKNKKCCNAKIKESNSLKYGCECVLKLETVKNKIKETNLERYGVENVFSSEDVKNKIKKTNLKKYGVENPILNTEIKNKAIETNLKKYGVENPFASEKIKDKIKKTNLKKYGVKIPTQNPEIRAKGIETCLEKYGERSYAAFYSKTHIGELSPTWKGGVSYHRVERATIEYRMWRKGVFDRDLYTCQCCGARSGNGYSVKLSAHHIKNWRDNITSRYNIDNGISLCEKCHMKFHSLYGKRNNNEEQLNEFLKEYKNLDKEIC